MKILNKLATGLAIAIGVIVSSGAISHAGEGRAAAAVAIQTNGLGLVTSLNASVAVGKNDATATFFNNNAGNLSTFAVGSAGTIVPGAAGEYTVGAESASALGIAQTRNLSTSTVLNTQGAVVIP